MQTVTWPETDGRAGLAPDARDPLESDPVRLWGLLLDRLKELFEGVPLGRSELDLIAWRVKSRRYSAGTVIAKGRARTDFWAFVARGKVAAIPGRERWHMRPRRRGRPAELLPPGSTFGEMVLAENGRSEQTLCASTDVEIYLLQRSDLMQVLGPRRFPVFRVSHSHSKWLGVTWVSLFAATIVAWVVLGLVYRARGFDGKSSESGPLASPGTGVRIETPLPAQIVEASEGVTVRAVIEAPGMAQAALQVDGRVVSAQVQARSASTPWTAQWTLASLGEGPHLLAVRASGPDGASASSAPVRVTVVPGGELVFSGNCEGQQAVYSMRTDGTHQERLTSAPRSAEQPSLAPSGALAFVTERESGQPQISWLMPGSDEVVTLVVGRDPAWSPDASRLAYAFSESGVSQIHVLEVGSGTAIQVTSEEVYAGQPSWSADGRSLAYVAEREGNLDIWAVDLEKGGVRRLTDDPATDWGPAWSPDGTQLAFVSNRSGSHQLYVMNSDGRNVRQVTEMAQGADSPAWSPGSYWLAFVAYTGSGAGVNAREIYLIRADGQDPVRLTYDACDDTHPAWRYAP